MRIISGTHKGHIIKFPKKLKARPTTDFSKESLFNILDINFNIQDLEALDLFTGTGSIGFEFASRGCKKVICVDENFHSISFISDEINNIGLSQIKPIKSDILKFLKHTTDIFDVIFADPPYNFLNHNQIIDEIFQGKILREKGWLILEHDSGKSFSDHKKFKEHRFYGQTVFTIFM